MGLARDIFELQELDIELDAQRRSLDAVEARLGDDRDVVAAGAQVEALIQRRRSLEREVHTREGDLEELTRKLSTEESKMYSGRVTSFKELEDLQTETQRLRQTRQRQEEQLLSVMEETEAVAEQIVTGQEQLEVMRERWQEEQAVLAQRRKELLEAIAGLEGRREAVVQRIEPSPLHLYEDLRRSRQTAVALVEQGRCRGCRVALSMNELQKARAAIIQCSSCGRILYSP